jgi:hypothetical protein
VDPDPDRIEWQDPDPDQNDKLDPDPYPHQSDKLDRDPHQFAYDKPKCMEYVSFAQEIFELEQKNKYFCFCSCVFRQKFLF